MVRPHANIWYMILYVHTCCFFLSCFLSYVVYYATWLFTCMPEYICSIFKVCFSFSCIFSIFMYVYLMYMCLFLLQRTQDRCSTYEECARCKKGLQSSDTDCNQLRDEQGCNTILYTNDTAPSKYLHVHTGMLCMHTDTYLSCTLLKTSLCYCIHMCLCFHFIILFWIISWDSLKEDAIHVYKRCYLCSLFMPCLAHTLSSLHVVSVGSGTAIPTSLYMFEKCFLQLYTCPCAPAYSYSLPQAPTLRSVLSKTVMTALTGSTSLCLLQLY